MNRFLHLRRIVGAFITFAVVLPTSAVFADTPVPLVPPLPNTVVGTPDSADIGSCSVVPLQSSRNVTPVVVFATPPTVATTVYFTFFDVAGKPVGMQAVVVPAPPQIGLPQPLTPFAPPAGFVTAHCDTKPPTTAALPPPPASGANTGLILGVLGGAGLLGIALGSHGGGSSSPSSNPTMAPTFPPTPTATPTVAPTATPTIAPTATPTIAPTATPTSAPTASPSFAPTASPSPTIAPTASPSPTTAPTATPTPTMTPSASPAPGSLALNPSTLNFYAAGSAYNQNTVATQSNYTGPFSETGTTCPTNVATISQSGATFTVTPVGAGATCTFTISGGNNMSAMLTVNVTTSSGTINAKHPTIAPIPQPGKAPKK